MTTSKVFSTVAVTLGVIATALGTSSPNLAARRPMALVPPVPVTASFDTCLVDAAGNQLIWDSTTGAYRFTRASDGFVLTGTGMVGLVNGIRTLKDFKTDRRLSAGFNTGQLTGTATIYVMVGQGVWQSTQFVDTNPSAMCTPPPVITSFSSSGNCVAGDSFIAWASTGGISAVLEHLRNNIVISSVSVPTSGSVGGRQLTPVTECEDLLTLIVTGPGGTATQTIELIVE